MSDETLRQAIVDEAHLSLLSLGYMISAATTAFFSIFGLFYMAMGIFMGTFISHQRTGAATGQEPPAFMGWIFGVMGAVVFFFAVALAAAKLRTAICIKRRRSRTFCMIVAGVSCLGVPYGTTLGVLSFIVLGRDSVVRLFNPPVPPKPTDDPAS